MRAARAVPMRSYPPSTIEPPDRVRFDTARGIRQALLSCGTPKLLLPPMISTTHWPWLPVEVVERIISQLWSSQLSADERVTLLISCPLVNKSWQDMFMRVSMTDVHIPCPSYAHQYLRVLRQESPIYPEDVRELPDILCQSLNFEVQSTPPTSGAQDTAQSASHLTVSSVMYQIDALDYLPNLRHVSVSYINRNANSPFDAFRLADLPRQVTSLSVQYTMKSATPTRPLDTLHTRFRRCPEGWWALSDITRVSIFQFGERWMEGVVEVQPHASVAEKDVLDAYASLPAVLSTLLLRTPSVALDEKEVMTLEEVIQMGTLDISPRANSAQRFAVSGTFDGFS